MFLRSLRGEFFSFDVKLKGTRATIDPPSNHPNLCPTPIFATHVTTFTLVAIAIFATYVTLVTTLTFSATLTLVATAVFPTYVTIVITSNFVATAVFIPRNKILACVHLGEP